MKKFQEFMNEEVQPAALSRGFVGVDDESVRDNINTLLAGITGRPYVNPYMALQRIAKTLAYFHIVIPQYTFTEGEHGMTTFSIDQFGLKVGMNDQGQMVKKPDDNYYVYFEWMQNNQGMFETFCEVVTQDELDEIMDDIRDEEENVEVDKDESLMSRYHTMNMVRMKDTSLNEDSRRDFVGKEMHKFKHGELHSGSKKGPLVTNRKQAIAIALSSARKKGLEEEQLDEISKKKLSDYVKKASHDVATKSAAVGRYADRANKARDKMKKGDYSDWQQGKKDDEFADKMFKKSWNRRKGIAKAVDKLTKEETDAPFEGAKTKKTPNPEKRTKQLAQLAAKEAKKKILKKKD